MKVSAARDGPNADTGTGSTVGDELIRQCEQVPRTPDGMDPPAFVTESKIPVDLVDFVRREWLRSVSQGGDRPCDSGRPTNCRL